LLLDDFKDLIEDRVSKDENTIIELGNDAGAIKKAYQFGMDDLDKLKEINPVLAKFMQGLLTDALTYRHIIKEIGD
jgi:hypothetical protein